MTLAVPEEFDAVVIGEGISGVFAALELKSQSKASRIAIIAQAPGATSLSSGAWDFGPLGTNDPADLRSNFESETWQKLYRSMLVETPPPYFAELEVFFREIASRVPVHFSPERAMSLPTTAGKIRRVFAAHVGAANADLSRLSGKRIGVVGSKSWRYFPELLAKSWKAQTDKMGVAIHFEAKYLDLRQGGGEGRDIPLTHYGARLRLDTALREDFCRSVREIKSDCDVLLFPPICADDNVRRDVGAAAGGGEKIAECLGSSDPLPGWRLQQNLRALLRREGIDRFTVSHALADTAAGQVEGIRVTLEPEKGWTHFRARTFVLATGKFLGGGIEINYLGPRETLFGLPLFTARNEPVLRRETLFHERIGFRSSQTWAKLGLWLDDTYRPLNSEGKIVFENLYACGSAIGGADLAVSNIGLGYLSWTGRQCGHFASTRKV